jgi:hypothetical protein
MGNLAACEDVVIWAIDLKKGMELGPWAPCIDRLATTPEEATTLLSDAVKILEARAAHLAEQGERVWNPRPTCPHCSSSSTSTPNWRTMPPQPSARPTRSLVAVARSP